MKSTKTGSVHQVIVGRASLTESSQGYPQIRKEQVGREGREGGREGTHITYKSNNKYSKFVSFDCVVIIGRGGGDETKSAA